MTAGASISIFPHPAACPMCHSVGSEITAADLAAGRGWRCKRCDQHWDAVRLEAVAAYSRFVVSRSVSVTTWDAP